MNLASLPRPLAACGLLLLACAPLGGCVTAAVAVATAPIRVAGEVVEAVVDNDENEKTDKEHAREQRRKQRD